MSLRAVFALLLFLFPVLSAPPVRAASSLPERIYDSTGIEINGFAETVLGTRLTNDPVEKQLSAADLRLRLEASRDLGETLLTFKGDLNADGVREEMEGDLRELSLSLSPLPFMDLKLGRAVFTWGTGDLLFINDTFAKDWQSFFIGRSEEYLKYPNTALKVSLFSDLADLDIIYSPLFGDSRHISGERLSYYNPMAGRIVGREMEIDPDEPNRFFRDDELHLRLSRTLGGLELALYGYSGFWQEPEGVSAVTGRPFYPRLNVWGGSVRKDLLGGIVSAEAGWYDSRDNPDAHDPLIRPSEFRWLIGYEHELARELTGSVQYYVETIQDYGNYRQALPTGAPARDESTGTVTLRLTKLLLNQDLTLSLFVYYSPDRDDGYARPRISYRLSDRWLLTVGANLFWGRNDNTFWGQFQDNTNIYAGLRVSM